MAEEPAANAEPTLQWFKQPMELLDRIRSFLSTEDKNVMDEALGTKQYILHLPSQWKIRDMKMTEGEIKGDYFYTTHMARKCGHLIKTVVIDYPGFDSDASHSGWMGHFLILLQILSEKSRPTAIRFCNLEKCLRRLGDPWYNYICMAIADFFRTQKEFKNVSFRNCFFKYSDCIRILRRAIESNKGITRLELDGFLEWEDIDKDDSACEQILPEILSLPNLLSLHIDHRLILGEKADDEAVLKALVDCQKKLDMKIFLRINADSCHLKKFETDQWITLNTKNPNLHVEMEISSASTFSTVTKLFIAPNTPITDLTYKFNPTLPHGLSIFLKHLSLCKIYETLRKLNFKFERRIFDLDSRISKFLKDCKKLEYLELSLVDPMKSLGDFLESFLKKLPESMKEITFNFTIREDRFEDVESAMDDYGPRFDAANIVLFYYMD